MGLEGEAHLHNAPAQQDQADGTDQAEDELTEVIDHSQRIAAGGRNRNRQGAGSEDGQHRQGIAAEAPLNPAGDGELFGGCLFVFLEQFHGFLSPF